MQFHHTMYAFANRRSHKKDEKLTQQESTDVLRKVIAVMVS